MKNLNERMTPLEQAQYLTTMIGMGYSSIKPIRGGNYWAGLYPFVYTSAIVVGEMGDEVSMVDRWCYDSSEAAKVALDNWDGTGEPEGWHRHPFSGRRRKDGIEYVAM